MTYSSSRSVPVEIPNINHGFQVAKGLLKVREKGLELEYEIQDAFFGATYTDVQTVFLAYDKLQEIRFKKGWFSGKIIVEANSMKDVKEIPEAEHASFTLKVKRKHRDEAQNVISTAQVQLSEQKLGELNGDDADYS